MNTEFRIKWLLNTLNKNQEQGFDWINLMVVLFILGLLAAIVWPRFLTERVKNQQAEAKQYASAVNKSQQAYYTENSKFVTESTPEAWANLGIGIKTQTTNYKYFIYSIDKDGVNVFAIPLNKNLKGYTGFVALVNTVAGADKTSQAVVCETKNAGEVPMPGSVPATGDVQCPEIGRGPCCK